jgi:hypothetical protein
MVLGVPPRLELMLATLESRMVVVVLELNLSSTESSLQGATPTMMEPPRMEEFLLRALDACSLVWNLMCIQLELGGIRCCSTVPQEPNCCSTKLAAEGGKPQTVTQVTMDDESSDTLDSSVEQLPGVEGNTDVLVSGVAKVELFNADLLGVMVKLFMSPVVGGPPGLSPGVRVDLLRVSFKSWGPRRGWEAGIGELGVLLGEERFLLSLLGEIMPGRRGVEGDITGSPIRKPGRKPACVGC